MHHVCVVTLLCAGFVLSAQAQDAPSASSPFWIADEATGCLAATPAPSPNERIDWSGDCVDGLIEGEGILTWFDGEVVIGRDSGNFEAGMLSGRGRIESSDGWFFEGSFPGSGIMGLTDGSEVPAQSIRQNSGWHIQQTHETDL